MGVCKTIPHRYRNWFFYRHILKPIRVNFAAYKRRVRQNYSSQQACTGLCDPLYRGVSQTEAPKLASNCSMFLFAQACVSLVGQLGLNHSQGVISATMSNVAAQPRSARNSGHQVRHAKCAVSIIGCCQNAEAALSQTALPKREISKFNISYRARCVSVPSVQHA